MRFSLLKSIKRLFDFNDHYPRAGCPACDNSRVICIDADSFDDNYAGPFNKIKQLKFGELIQCTICEQVLYKNTQEIYVDVVPKSRLADIEEWDAKKLSLSDEQLQTLLEIGATPSDNWANENMFSIPCKCTLLSGEIIEHAIISIQQKPPIGLLFYGDNGFLWLDQVKSIEPSQAAFPLAIRIAASKSEEVRMGFSPTLVMAPNQQFYIINGAVNFFDQDGLKGKDFILVQNQRMHENQAIYANSVNTVRILVDWKPAHKKLFLIG